MTKGTRPGGAIQARAIGAGTDIPEMFSKGRSVRLAAVLPFQACWSAIGWILCGRANYPNFS